MTTGIVSARLSQNLSRNIATEWPAWRSWAPCSVPIPWFAWVRWRQSFFGTPSEFVTDELVCRHTPWEYVGTGQGADAGRWHPQPWANSTVNVAPRPGPSLATPIVPPIASTNDLVIVRPSPLPPASRERDGSTR